jgi:hypothetical protein
VRIKLLGKRWNWLYATPSSGNAGDCDPPDTPHRTIRICPRLKGVERLEIELHEMLHGTDWHKDEEWVRCVSHDIAGVLWRLGYRRTDG